nr:MAG TPA: AAA domain protein [Caudoviricetes sp.]
MLISFGVSGYRSINEKVEINFDVYKNQRIKGTKYEPNYFLDRRIKLAKSVVLFGDNAAGKSNILEAIKSLHNIISRGIRLEKEAQNINNKSDKTSYEAEFLIKNDIYEYHLTLNKNGVVSEKLIKNDTIIYDFKDNKLTFEQYPEIEKIFSVQSKETILKKIEDNKIPEIDIFQQEHAMREAEDSVYRLIGGILEVGFLTNKLAPFPNIAKELIENNREASLKILRILDKSIDDFFFYELDENRNFMILKRSGKNFAIEEESNGIKKIISILPSLSSERKNDMIFVIDELDSSISTKALMRILNGVINSPDNNKSQFILSSHNPMIFDTSLLSPSQIYIVSKENCDTKVKCLDQFEPRSDKRKAYLNYLRGDYE